MSKFIRSVPFKTEYDGDSISMNLQPLKRKDILKLAPFMGDGESVGTLDSFQMMDVGSGLIPNYVTNFKGLVDAEDQQITIEEAVDESYFTELVSIIMQELFAISNMGKDDSKNSHKPLTKSAVAQAISGESPLLESPASPGFISSSGA